MTRVLWEIRLHGTRSNRAGFVQERHRGLFPIRTLLHRHPSERQSAMASLFDLRPAFLRPGWYRAQAAARRPVQPGWTVQATVDEPVALLRAFVAHHLEAGAAQVHLYLDRDDPATAADLGRDRRVRVTVCDAAYWRASHWRARPVLHTSRQIVNATRAYREADHAWMLFADADEFLVCEGDFADILRDVPREADFLRIPVAERFYAKGAGPDASGGLYGGLFRTALDRSPKLQREIYGPDARFLHRGLLAHIAGKSVVRTRRVLQMGLHWPKPYAFWGGTRDIADAPAFHRFAAGAHIAHFDGLTPRHWLLKLLRKYQLAARAAGPGQAADLANRTDARKRQIHAVREARGDATALFALTRMQELGPVVMRRLRQEGGLLDIAPDPDVAAARLYPDHAAPTVAGFDAALIARSADLIAEFGLTLD